MQLADSEQRSTAYAMRNNRKRERICQCLSYGKIEPEKFERLRKYRQRQLCSVADVAPFSERREETLSYGSLTSNGSCRPLFPAIREIPLISSYESDAQINIARKKALASQRTNTNRVGHVNCSSVPFTRGTLNGWENGTVHGNCNGVNTETQSLKIRLPKINNSCDSVMNQEL